MIKQRKQGTKEFAKMNLEILNKIRKKISWGFTSRIELLDKISFYVIILGFNQTKHVKGNRKG